MERLYRGKAVTYYEPTEEEPLPPPPEERFAEVFEAARVLLKEGVQGEDQIIPTLAFANEIGQGIVEPDADRHRLLNAAKADTDEQWEMEAEAFVSRYVRMRPVRIANGVVILESLPAFVRIKDVDSAGREVQEAHIEVYPHSRPARPEHVRDLYDRTLTISEIPHYAADKGSVDFDFSQGYLSIIVRGASYFEVAEGQRISWVGKRAPLPHPRLVEALYRALLGTSGGDGFARYLSPRKRGPGSGGSGLILACIAFYLRYYGNIKGRKETQRLLNEHAIRPAGRRPLPEGHSSEATQLWQDVENPRKVGNPLMAAGATVFFQEPHGWG